MVVLPSAFVTVPDSQKSSKWMFDMACTCQIANGRSYFIAFAGFECRVQVGNN